MRGFDSCSGHIMEVFSDDLVRRIVHQIKKTENARQPSYELPPDSFLEQAIKQGILDFESNFGPIWTPYGLVIKRPCIP